MPENTGFFDFETGPRGRSECAPPAEKLLNRRDFSVANVETDQLLDFALKSLLVMDLRVDDRSGTPVTVANYSPLLVNAP